MSKLLANLCRVFLFERATDKLHTRQTTVIQGVLLCLNPQFWAPNPSRLWQERFKDGQPKYLKFTIYPIQPIFSFCHQKFQLTMYFIAGIHSMTVFGFQKRRPPALHYLRQPTLLSLSGKNALSHLGQTATKTCDRLVKSYVFCWIARSLGLIPCNGPVHTPWKTSSKRLWDNCFSILLRCHHLCVHKEVVWGCAQ